jgi:hypothetical protein
MAGMDRQRAMACVPVKNERVREQDVGGGLVRLVYRLPYRPWFTRLTRAMGKPEQPMLKKLELDEMGSAAWRLMDGRRCVAEVAAAMAEAYDLYRPEAEAAVSAFVRDLGRRGVIGLQEPGDQPEEDQPEEDQADEEPEPDA